MNKILNMDNFILITGGTVLGFSGLSLFYLAKVFWSYKYFKKMGIFKGMFEIQF